MKKRRVYITRRAVLWSLCVPAALTFLFFCWALGDYWAAVAATLCTCLAAICIFVVCVIFAAWLSELP